MWPLPLKKQTPCPGTCNHTKYLSWHHRHQQKKALYLYCHQYRKQVYTISIVFERVLVDYFYEGTNTISMKDQTPLYFHEALNRAQYNRISRRAKLNPIYFHEGSNPISLKNPTQPYFHGIPNQTLFPWRTQPNYISTKHSTLFSQMAQYNPISQRP